MKTLGALAIACICICGCAGIPHIKAPGRDTKYSYVIADIPVIRPSTWDPNTLIEGARRLSGNYRKSNIVFGFEYNSKVPRLDPSKNRLKDHWWLETMEEGHWNVKGWNYDPGTTANVYLKRGGGDAPPLYGEVVFMKGGMRLGMLAIAGGRNLADYYREMKELGIYIPR